MVTAYHADSSIFMHPERSRAQSDCRHEHRHEYECGPFMLTLGLYSFVFDDVHSPYSCRIIIDTLALGHACMMLY